MYTQQQEELIEEGQKRINGELCRVDWNLIEALRALTAELAAVPTLSRLNLDKVEKLIEIADRFSKNVADIRPPGCIPEDRTDPIPGVWPPVDYQQTAS